MRIAEVAVAVPLHKTYHYEVPAGMRAQAGSRVRVAFGPRRLTGVVMSLFDGEPAMKLKPIEQLLDPRQPILDEATLELARWLSKRLSAPIGECIRAALPSFVKSGEEPVEAAMFRRPNMPQPSPAFTLTPGQDAAVRRLGELLEARRFANVLLYGVPASGKTEVYLRLIRKAVASGGQALFLLPEIALTQPFFEEFSASLSAPVVLWHSQLGQRERRLAWLGLRRGLVKVVVGARSAALLPLPDLRLAVLDEEQDESFKQEGQSPLYHARDVAIRRCERAGALCVMGSATPSLEAWEMGRDGRAEVIRLADRVSSVARPKVELLPLPPFGEVLSAELLARVKDRLAKREQSILLVNRRGFSTLLMCRKCGWVDRCEDCGVAKIQHQEADGSFVLRCHHCERHWPVPAHCARCRQPAVRASGIGTQKVVSELRKALPGVRVLRLDRDTASKGGQQERKVYQRFLAREADILVGTKLVAKSFHFPDVTLVGVVDADTMLHMPDFRSSERTMQLLAQVSGRSGRAQKPGEVLLQTLHPDHAAISGTVQGDYALFAETELAARRELGYPPYRALVRLIWLGAKEENVAEAAAQACEALRPLLSPLGCEVVGPAPAVLRLAQKKFRYHALLKAPHERLSEALERCRGVELPSTVKLKVNVEPYDLF